MEVSTLSEYHAKLSIPALINPKDTPASELEAVGTSDPGKLINQGRKFLDAGVERLMIESEGITENVKSWRTDVVSQIMKELPQEKVMFEGECSPLLGIPN